jgi:glycosyltransferase involved in cell wall biosynthesis
MKEGLKLSIIVPVYNVENYIRDCLNSIFRQNLKDDDFEVIIINDGTEDNSMTVISDIISPHHNIIIVNQENQGSSVAWNKGIAMANGEYILLVDADDLLIERRLKLLLEKAVEMKADIVVPDFIEVVDKDITELKVALLTASHHSLSFQETTGREMFLMDLHPSECYVWRKLYRKKFLIQNHISFVPGIHFQDIPFTTECYIVAGKCYKASQLFYIYRKRNVPVTHEFSFNKSCENTIAIAKTWELISRYQLTGEIKKKLQENVFTNFTNFSIRVSLLSKDFKEREIVFNRLRENAPDLYFSNNVKQKFISFIFWHFPMLYNYMNYFYTRIYEVNIRSFYYRLEHILSQLF